MKPSRAVKLDRIAGRWLVYPLHKRLYKWTGGRIGKKTAQGPVILLTHTGRWVVVGSNGGREEHPQWVHNVAANPDVEVQDGRRKVAAVATVADEERKAELWPLLGEQYKGWEHYQTLTERDIQVVELRPVGG